MLQALFDLVVVLLVVSCVVVISKTGSSVQSPLQLTASCGLSLGGWLLIANAVSGAYIRRGSTSTALLWVRALLAALVVTPVSYVVFELLQGDAGVWSSVQTAGVLGIAAVTIHRVYATRSRSPARPHKLLIVGSGDAALAVASTVRNEVHHAHLVGNYSADGAAEGPSALHPAGLVKTATTLGVDEIVVAVAERRGGRIPLRELLECKLQGIRVSDLSTYFERHLGQIRVDYCNAGWLVFGDGFEQGLWRTSVKRCFDVLMATVLLVLAAPVMLLTMILIVLESGTPVIYRQDRVGLKEKTFKVFKFRSMRLDAEIDGKPRWAVAADDRVTRVGRFIRKSRIDELPQLLNVLLGEMSLVGPRPERPFFVDQLARQLPYYSARMSVKPGLTGWAQVRYQYGSSLEDAKEKLQYDLYYVKNNSLLLDSIILLETVSVVLTGKGAR